MLRSEVLVLFLLAIVSTHLHVMPAPAQRCPNSCGIGHRGLQFDCHCPVFNLENSRCSWVGHEGKTYNSYFCMDAVPTGFQEGTHTIFIKHLRSPIILEWSFPNISSLQGLRIEKSNVSAIEPGAFRGLHSVWRLSIVENRISRLEPDTFIGLERLKLLYLNKNAISSISPYAFRGLPCISVLKLHQNQLTSVPVEALLQPKALKVTHLNQNHIATINSNVLHLEHLHVQVNDNELRCDENLAWFVCHLPHLLQISHRYDLKCQSPEHLQGTVLTSLMQNVCQTNTEGSHGGIGYTTEVSSSSPKHGNVPIPSPNVSIAIPSYNKNSPTNEDRESPYTNDVPVSQYTTEVDRVVILWGSPIINKADNSTYTMAMIVAVVLPLLLVFTSVGVLLICKRWCGAGLADGDQPTGTDEEESEGSQNIEPYAVVYSDSTGLQGSDNNSPTGSQPSRAQPPVDSETIQPYAVAYDEDQGPESDIRPYAVAYDEDQGQEYGIKPYAVAYKEDVGQDESCKIPLYGAGCSDTPQAAGGHTEAGSTHLENITNQQAAIVDEPVAQPEDQSPPTDAATEPKYVKEEGGNKRSTSDVLYNPANGQHESKDSTSGVLYNPAHGQHESVNSTTDVLYNLADGQHEIVDSTPNVMYNSAHGQHENVDSTSNVQYNLVH
uniref:EGF-like domain-containing protein n=1 Tax=Branchiostoma floridae TaxID=7739 RepID=C3Y9A9_BRAFL|eukprot:XP_002607155.1 hypothetical protein BRAFLDRAFT_68051 [Branchiostoma floridae]